jgi:circadian clock protein KaiB
LNSEYLDERADKRWQFRLYLSGGKSAAYSLEAIVRDFLDSRLAKYSLEVIDLQANPARAEADRILALPCLVRVHPEPRRTVIGNFTNILRMEHVLECRLHEK